MVCSFTQFLQNVKIPSTSQVMTTSVLEFTPKYMVRCNFKRIFLKKVFFQLQKPKAFSFFKIDPSNLVGILFNTFRKDSMIQNFDFWSEFWEKKFWNFFSEISENFWNFFFQNFFSRNSDQKSKFWIIEFFLNELKIMPTKFEGPILKNGRVISFWSWKNTFLSKMRLKLQHTMHLV